VTTSFALDAETEEQKRKAAEQYNRLADQFAKGGGRAMSPDEYYGMQEAQRQAQVAEQNQQARQGGVNRADTQVTAAGIGGFFGAKDTTSQYTAQNVADTTTAGNKASLADEIGRIRNSPTQQMQGATINMSGTGGNYFAADRAAADQARGQQMSLAQSLAARAAGQGSSLAQMQMQQATDQSLASAMALARSGRGNPAVAMKAAQMQNGMTTQQAAGQSAQLRLQEQMQAQGQLADVLGQVRGGDLNQQAQALGLRGQDASLATSQAGLDQDASKTNMLTAVEQQKQREELVKQYLAMGMALDEAQRAAQIQQNQFNAGLLAQQEAAKHGVSAQNAAAGAQTAGATAAALGSVLAAAASDRRAKRDIKPGETKLAQWLSSISVSDEREKSDIKPGEDKLSKWLGRVGAHDYEYKNPDEPLRGRGRFVSPMAQELEQSEIGKSMVINGPDGTKVVDYGKGFGATVAALGWMHKRLNKMEGKNAR
jgi:hypothetical protein